MRQRSAWMLPFVLGFVACDPGVRVSGRVVDPNSQPVSGATVRARCEERDFSGLKEATTDTEGRFELRGLGCLPRTCVLRVEGNGLAAEILIGSLCTRSSLGCREADYCNVAEGRIVVSPAPR